MSHLKVTTERLAERVSEDRPTISPTALRPESLLRSGSLSEKTWMVFSLAAQSSEASRLNSSDSSCADT